MPDYEDLEWHFAVVGVEGPFGWDPVAGSFTEEEEARMVNREDNEDGIGQDGHDGDGIERGESNEEIPSDSYYGTDVDEYILKGPRDRDLTLPVELDELTASEILTKGIVKK